MSWSDAEDTAGKYGSGLFVKFNDGDSVVLAFLGEPEARETVWINGKTFDYDKDDPAHAAINPTAKFRFNAFVPGGGIKILEMSLTTFGKVVALKKKYGNFDTNLYEITRIGSGTKTDYQILPERECTAAELEAIKGAELHDLTPRPPSDGSDGDAEGNASAGASDDSHTAEYIDELKSRLKQLPGTAVKDFLGAFGVSKIKDLAEADFAKADAFVTNLETQRDGGVDPFAD